MKLYFEGVVFSSFCADCKTADKEKFNQNIVQVFTDEYKRAVVDPLALTREFKATNNTPEVS